jgi:aspartate/methionine/tyrosine aminotransferase
MTWGFADRPSRFAAGKMGRIRQSGIRRVAEKAWKLEAEGHEVIHLEVGRVDFDTPQPVKEAAMRAMREGQVHYTPSPGLPALREAVAADLKRRLGMEVDPAREVLITVGSSTAIMISLMTVLGPGDEILVPEPMYLFYVDWGEFFGARTVSVPLRPEDGYQISREALERCATSRTKVVVINTPHNPTGAVLDRASLEAVAAFARERDLLVLSDEAYDRLVYPPWGHTSITTFPGMKERTVLTNSFSKSFAMDGWRLGYVVGPADLIWEIDKAQQHTVITATNFVQWGGVAALQGGDALVQPMVEEYAGRRQLVLDLLASAPFLQAFEPQGAFYFWIRTPPMGGGDGWELADVLLERARVAVTPGEVFGPSGRGHIRVSYSNSREKIRIGMERLIEVIGELR